MENRIIDRVKGSIREKEFENLSVDYVNIPWYDAGKRIQKLVSKKGITIGIRLGSDSVTRGLLQDDVLDIINGEAIVVNILEDECITVKAHDIKTVAKVCYEIGNRHASLFYSDDYSELILPYDKPMFEMLNKLEVEVQIKRMKIHRNKSISSVNASTHSHSHVEQESYHQSNSYDIIHNHNHDHIHDNNHSHHHDHDHSHKAYNNHHVGTQV